MGKSQLVAIALAVTALCGLYFLGNTSPPKKQNAAAEGNGTHEHASHTHNWDTFYSQAFTALPEHAKAEIKNLEAQLQDKDSTAMRPFLLQLSDSWLAHKQPAVAGYYKAIEAKLENSEKSLTFAGQFLLDVANLEGLPEESRHWAYEQAAEVLAKAVQINPESDTAQMAYGVALIEGMGQTMQGVQQLLAVTRRNPDHIPANMILGRMSIQSGQWDKAVERFEIVLRKEPHNREALFFLAEAYKGKGDKAKGVETLNKLKTIVDDPEFTKDIDNYIKTF